MQKETLIKRIIKFSQSKGYYIHTKDFKSAGFRSSYIKELVDQGILEKLKAGLYRLTDIDEPNEISLDLVDCSKAVPGGVICLLSALSHYELTTFNPSYVEIAIKNNLRAPKVIFPPIHIYYFRNRFYESGIDQVKTIYGTIQIYSIEKTICDVFRYRKKIGEDVFIEALKNYFNSKKANLTKLHEMVELCQIKKMISPYIKSIVG